MSKVGRPLGCKDKKKRGISEFQLQWCECWCGGITKPGKRFILGHNSRVMTQETKKKVSINSKKGWTKEIRSAFGVHLKGNKNALGMVYTEQWKREHRLRMIGENNPMYSRSPGHGKGCWFDVPNQGRVFLRSTFELSIAIYLVDKRIDFIYEYKRFILDAKTFLPDFYLIKEDKFWEAKGWAKEEDLQKLREMKIFYPNINIELITGDVFNKIKLGII